MKLLLIFPVFFSFALVRDIGVAARPNTDGLNTVDAATSEATSSPSSWVNASSNMMRDEKIWNTVLEYGNNAAQVAASLGFLIAEKGVDYVKKVLQSLIPVGNSVINGGSALTAEVLELMEAIPGLVFLPEVGKTAVNMTNSLGTNALNADNIFQDGNLDFANNFSQTNALPRTSLEQGMITNGTLESSSVIDIGLDGIESLDSEGNPVSDCLDVEREGSVSTRNIVRVPPR